MLGARTRGVVLRRGDSRELPLGRNCRDLQRKGGSTYGKEGQGHVRERRAKGKQGGGKEQLGCTVLNTGRGPRRIAAAKRATEGANSKTRNPKGKNCRSWSPSHHIRISSRWALTDESVRRGAEIINPEETSKSGG